ncbi:hypothetical protein IW261DRAFT_1413420 [Armillaria novae-zelandiae]|uniref:Uncharacterized protein n=1 Tax=Armillaria novae-zelandiae TaxID=153914 RepID=A0AA39PUW7_9AGAR|nr:hypothetical protein IW261DRAFT_1413420 [Armillaria novae-zelandiae]
MSLGKHREGADQPECRLIDQLRMQSDKMGTQTRWQAQVLSAWEPENQPEAESGTPNTVGNRKKYNKKAIQMSVVLRTWQGVLEDEEFLPEDWTKLAGVLVGMHHYHTE